MEHYDKSKYSATDHVHTLQSLLNGIRDHAIIRTDVEGIILEWNAGAEKLFGWKKEEIVGQNASIIFTPEDRAKDADEKEKIQASVEGRADDKRWHVRKDGSRFYANGILNSMIDNGGKTFGFIKVLRDDTDRLRIEEAKKKAEQVAESTQKQMYSFFEQSPTAMVILEGPDHFIKLANPPYERLVQRKVTGKKVLEAFTEEEVKHFIPLLDSVYQTGKPFIGRELPLNIPNEKGEIEQHWVNVNYFPHFDESGEVIGILCDVHEVTDLILAKRSIQASEEQFRALANSLPQIIWTATPDGYVDWYNDWWYKYLGMPQDTKWDDEKYSPMHPEDVKITWPLWKKSLASGEPFFM
jgi:PAS domain S-box-containing protein